MIKSIYLLLLVCLCFGCKNEVIEMPHPSRELAELPIIQEFDKFLQLTGQIKWIKEGILWKTYRFLSGKAPEEYTEFFPAYVPEEMIGKEGGAVGLWYWCPNCEKWIPCSYENCPICDRKMKRKFTSP